MLPDFWLARWQQGQHGFHQATVNAGLARYWATLGLEPGDRVFVPLCGKSLDMWWLAERGHPVVGVELSPIAVRDFFREAGLEPERSQDGPFEVSSGRGVRVLRGDFFALRPEDLTGVRGVYDRAALIALPPNLRKAYVDSLARKLPPNVSILVLTFESSSSSIDGPPFTVHEKEIRELYEPEFCVEVLDQGPFTEAPPNLRSRGHETVRDVIYSMVR